MNQGKIWHPCSQMKDYETFKPLSIACAEGSYLILSDGRKIIDAISSWWCKSLGHNHPRLQESILRQIKKFEHVILANTTNETIEQLTQEISNLTTTLPNVFYAGDGACAIEIAMKMSLQTRYILGETQRNKFIALENSYHGDTFAAMSVSDLKLYKDPFRALLHEAYFIKNIPYVNSTNDPLWEDCSAMWPEIKKQLDALAETTTALLVEPIVQGAAGMKIYSKDFLKRLRTWCTQHKVHLIADEIMTGIGRTGKMLACMHANIEPDFLCLSKGLTSGWMAFSAVATSNEIYNVFYDDYETGKAFLHSHTFSGNALAASVALEVLTIAKETSLAQQAEKLGDYMYAAMQDIAPRNVKVRKLGAIVAMDLPKAEPRLGYGISKRACELGALLRPLGNTLYWLPPLNTQFSVIDALKSMTQTAMASCC